MYYLRQFSYLLIIYLFTKLKCYEGENSYISIIQEFNETYNIKTVQKPEKLYYGKIKMLKNRTMLKNRPKWESKDNNPTFFIINGDESNPWPAKYFINNTKNKKINIDSCEVLFSVIDFEIDSKENIYILDEGNNSCPISLYIFDSKTGSRIGKYKIFEKANNEKNVTNFVLDTINNLIYIAYNVFKKETNEYEIGILVKDLTDENNFEIKEVKIDKELKRDERYNLSSDFLNQNFENITHKILNLALSCDSEVLFFCPLSTRKIYSVLTKDLLSSDIGEIKPSIINEAYKDDASSALISSNLGNLYLTGIEKKSIYIAGQIDNDLSIFNYKGIDKRNKIKDNKELYFPTDLAISDGNLNIISKHFIKEGEDKIILTTTIFETPIDKEKSYVYKCGGLSYKWDFKSYIIWGIFLLILCFILVFVFVENKEDKDINKKNN